MKPIKLIGVCLSTIHEEDRFNFIKAFNKQAVKNGYRLIVFNSGADLYKQNEEKGVGASAAFKLIPYEKLSALIVFPNIMYGSEAIGEIIEKCRLYNVPLLSIDKEVSDITFRFNYSDVFERLCCHVIEDHHARNILFMAGFEDDVYSIERLTAFRHALEKNNLPYDENNVGYGCFWEGPARIVLDRWFVEEKREIPDAIICANDFMAITVSLYLQSMGVKIPQECIVTGFDGIKQTEFLTPYMTTCKQNFDEMSVLIIDKIKRLESGEVIRGIFTVDFSIVYSQSCGCKPVTYDNVAESVRLLMESLRNTDDRQKMICHTQTALSRVSDISDLPRILINHFRFNTCIFALNDGVFEPPYFGSFYRNDNYYSDEVDVIFQCYNNKEYDPCRILLKDFFPSHDIFTVSDNPIIVYGSYFLNMIMGYCIFQPDVNIDEYEKMDNMMVTMGYALENYHSKMQIKSINNKLQKLSESDFMTGLLNRRGFFDRVRQIVGDGEFSGSALLIVSVDLDHLKYINDTFGHSEGDNAINTVGKALLGSSSRSSLCARFGGDEFCAAVFIDNEAPEKVYSEFKDSFLSNLVEYNRCSHKPYEVRASIGCFYALMDENFDVEQMINKADERMYEYKLKHKKPL